MISNMSKKSKKFKLNYEDRIGLISVLGPFWFFNSLMVAGLTSSYLSIPFGFMLQISFAISGGACIFLGIYSTILGSKLGIGGIIWGIIFTWQAIIFNAPL